MSLYPLGTIIEIVESISAGSLPMKVAYAYDDLVFMEHNAFLLQFAASAGEVFVHRNVAAERDTIEESITALKTAALDKGITICDGRLYRLEQAEERQITIHFEDRERTVSHD